MDGVRGEIKNKVYRNIKLGKVPIKGAESFAEYTNITTRNIKSLYLPFDDVLQELSKIDLAPKIKSTLETHYVRREFTIDGIAKLKFFKMALSKEPFYEHCHPKQGNPKVCHHPLLHLSFDIDNLCAVYKSPYLAKEHWPECNICNQWFHECFFMAQS